MLCPYCLHHFATESEPEHLGRDRNGHWWVLADICKNPECGRIIVRLQMSSGLGVGRNLFDVATDVPSGKVVEERVYPKGTNRRPVPPEVPDEFAKDYKEACLTLADSPNASAALSRRCLEHVLQGKAGVEHGGLQSEIKQVLSTGNLPSQVSNSLHYLLEIGNNAAHPTLDANTGEIVPVEPEEAEWCLEVIEMLFDHYFVVPANIKRRRKAFDEKMAAARQQP